MKDIAFHITDITENSLRAGATRIEIGLHLDANRLSVRIGDNGGGMDEQTVQQVTNPFYTTRTTRKVGLGLPFLFQNAQQCGGRAEIRSEEGRGTCVEAQFRTDHIDCPPAGDLAGTFMLLFTGNPSVEFALELSCDGKSFALTTGDLLQTLDGIPLQHPQVAVLVRELIAANLGTVFPDRLP